MFIKWAVFRSQTDPGAAAFIPGAQGLGQTARSFAASFMLDFGWGFSGVFICVLSQRQ